MVRADSGSAVVAGFDVERDPASVRRNVGLLIADERSWYWRLTGRENLEFFSALHGLRRGAAAQRTAELLELVGMSADADRSFGTYSSGMRLRLSLARALLARPRVLLLDEPTRSLDPAAVTSFEEILRQATSQATAAIVATHDLGQASRIADRTIALAGGRAHDLETPAGDERWLEEATRQYYAE
jgi:ABC-2 type transport system ATP-binding protein